MNNEPKTLLEFYHRVKMAIPPEFPYEDICVTAQLDGCGTQYKYEVSVKVRDKWKFGEGCSASQAIENIKKELGYRVSEDINIEPATV